MRVIKSVNTATMLKTLLLKLICYIDSRHCKVKVKVRITVKVVSKGE